MHTVQPVTELKYNSGGIKYIKRQEVHVACTSTSAPGLCYALGGCASCIYLWNDACTISKLTESKSF